MLSKAEAIAWIRSGSSTCLSAAKGFFDFAPHFLDGVEVRGVRGKKEDLSASLLNEREGQLAFVRREVVHNHHVAGSQRWAQEALDVGPKNFRIGGALDGHAGSGTIQADRGDHRRRMPVAIRGAGVDAFSALGATSQTGHIGLRARFIDEDERGRIETKLSPPPRSARSRDVWALLFASPECLFLYVRPICSRA